MQQMKQPKVDIDYNLVDSTATAAGGGAIMMMCSEQGGEVCTRGVKGWQRPRVVCISSCCGVKNCMNGREVRLLLLFLLLTLIILLLYNTLFLRGLKGVEL